MEVPYEIVDDSVWKEFDKAWDYGIPEGFGREEEVLCGEDAAQPPEKRARPMSLPCHRCGRTYKAQTALDRHAKVHNMEDALASSLPSLESVDKESQQLVDMVLAEWIQELPSFGHAPSLKELLEDLQRRRMDESFQSFIRSSVRHLCQCMPTGRYSPRSNQADVPLPSEIGGLFQRGLNKIISFRKVVPSDELLAGRKTPVKQLFITGFLRRLSIKLVAFIIKSLKGNRAAPTGDKIRSDADHDYYQEVVHYVGGSVVRRMLKVALRLQATHDKWASVVEIMQLHFLKSDLQSAPREKLEEWTRLQDRGSLLYLSKAALNFFVGIGDIAEMKERPDGSLIPEEVLDEVHGSPSTLELWENITHYDRALSQSDSQFVMDMATKLFCDTWGKGVVKRRTNAIHKHGYNSQAIRQKLAASSSCSREQML